MRMHTKIHHATNTNYNHIIRSFICTLIQYLLNGNNGPQAHTHTYTTSNSRENIALSAYQFNSGGCLFSNASGESIDETSYLLQMQQHFKVLTLSQHNIFVDGNFIRYPCDVLYLSSEAFLFSFPLPPLFVDSSFLICIYSFVFDITVRNSKYFFVVSYGLATVTWNCYSNV